MAGSTVLYAAHRTTSGMRAQRALAVAVTDPAPVAGAMAVMVATEGLTVTAHAPRPQGALEGVYVYRGVSAWVGKRAEMPVDTQDRS
jgi:hypothetical protein